VRTIETPVGTARMTTAPAARPWATLVLGHGAGGGVEAADLAALARHLPARGVTVVRVESPWRVAGRKVATPPPTLDAAWRAVLGDLRDAPDGSDPHGGVPVVVGGRSAGARVACRTALEVGALGCLALAFPLHPPGRPDRSRLAELTGTGVPTLVVQGERDVFGGPEQFPRDERYVVRRVPWADHGLRVPAAAPLTRQEALMLVVEEVSRWLTQLVGHPGQRDTLGRGR
jgi:predicted alpha/beta-hydrolase family hydrolase